MEREKRATLGFARFYYLFCCPGHPAEGGHLAACATLPDAAKGRGRLVELVLDEELDGLVFCHSEFVVEDCGVVVSLLCAEPEFSLV